jgi:hypothetical protein
VGVIIGLCGGTMAWAQETPTLVPTMLPSAEQSRLPDLSVNLLDVAPTPNRSGESVARDTTVHLRGFGIYSWANGSLTFGNEFPGIRHDLDLESTLGLDLDKFAGGVLLGFNFGGDNRLHFDLSWDGYYDYKGSKDVGSISFNGKVFTATVDSSARVSQGAGIMGFDFIKADKLTLTGSLGLRVFYIDAKLSERIGALSDSTQLWVPIPEPGIALRYDLTENLYVKGYAAYIWAGDLASYGNFTAEVGYDFNKNVGVFVGYRYWMFDLDYQDDQFHFDTSSVYAGVEVRI